MDDSSPTPFRLIAEYTYDWETWVDAQGVTRWINAALERITGYRVDTCLSWSDYPLALAYDEDRAILARVLEDARAGGSGNDVEFRVRCLDGSPRWVAISWQGVRTDAGALLGYRTSIRDIEERKRVEAELHVMRRRAEAAAIARSELLANVSHELRSPVHCIAGFADLLLDSQLDASQRHYLELMAHECTGMVRQVEDLLQLAAIEAGGARLEQRPFDLGALVEGVVEAARPTATARQLTLGSELSLPQPWALGDPTRIGQVLRNLLDNALKFTEQGSVRVLASAVQSDDSMRVELTVEDTGSGIDPDDVQRLLEPFQQASSASTRRHGGVGLGLSIVQRLVSAMHGTLRIESELGQGTRVRVVLPLLPGTPSVRPAEPGVPAPQKDHRGERALVVDDSAPARELLRAMLERHGYGVVEAESSRTAIARFDEAEFDLVLLDYQMPDADGTETALALRRALATRKSEKKTAIYLLTANVFARERVGGNAAIDGIFEKPLSRAGLAALLSELGGDTQVAATPRARSSLLDPLVIDDLAELTTQGGEPLLPRVVAQTQEAQARDLAALDEAVAELDQLSIARLAHNIAGQAAVVGAREVAKLARELADEAAAGELSREDAGPAAHALRRAWAQAARALLQVVHPEV
jgi:PAS domain S-box-containing protein